MAVPGVPEPRAQARSPPTPSPLPPVRPWPHSQEAHRQPQTHHSHLTCHEVQPEEPSEASIKDQDVTGVAVCRKCQRELPGPREIPGSLLAGLLFISAESQAT